MLEYEREKVNFAPIIKQLREENKITQTELAAKLGITNSVVSSYESGVKQPSHETIVKLAEYFHVTVDFLYGLEKNADKKTYIDIADLSEKSASNVRIIVNWLKSLENKQGVLQREYNELEENYDLLRYNLLRLNEDEAYEIEKKYGLSSSEQTKEKHEN